MKSTFEHEDFFVLRAPRFSISTFKNLPVNEADMESFFRDWISQKDVLEAIYLASPSLYSRLTSWLNGTKKFETKQKQKFVNSIVKYVIRMSLRPTPFGLFSGINMGQLSDKTAIDFDSRKHDGRVTRIDMTYLTALKNFYSKPSNNKGTVKYSVNKSHYFCANEMRYIEGYSSKQGMQYRLSSVTRDMFLDSVLALCDTGKTVEQIINSLKYSFVDLEEADIRGYVEELIEESVLTGDLSMPITGSSPDHSLIASLFTANENSTATILQSASQKINDFSDCALDLSTYKGVLNQLNSLPVRPDENKLFQADVYRNAKNNYLDSRIVRNILHKIRILAGVSHQPIDTFSQFKNEFAARYEGQYVPLLQVLDEESGIGFSQETGYESLLLAGLNINKSVNQPYTQTPTNLLGQLIVEKYTLPKNGGAEQIVIDSNEFQKRLPKNIENQLPASFATMFSIYEEIETNSHLIKFIGTYGPSAANLLGRFSHLNNELLESIKVHLKKEELHSPEVIFAEVAYMPEGRVGNVIARPHLRQYEVVFMTDSELDSEFQIPVSDLYVWVEGGKVKLWSKRLKKQVVPRLSSAHNYSSRSLGVYKFLSSLQMQYGAAPGFNLPQELSNASYVPRIMLDDIILSEKKWRVPKAELEQILVDEAIDNLKLASLKAKYLMDSVVCYAVYDNVLTINLHNSQMVRMLLSECRGQTLISLSESLNTKYNTPVLDNEQQSLANEIILPIFNPAASKHVTIKPMPSDEAVTPQTTRVFVPGSDWLSIKIYGGNTAVESFFLSEIMPTLEGLKNHYKKWFFIRYGDPGWHIRLRFSGKPEILNGEVLSRLSKIFNEGLNQGLIEKIELFTYQQEIERYGGTQCTPLCETLFMLDSELISELLSHYGTDDELIRLRAVILYSDSLMTSLGLNLEEKLQLVSKLREGFGMEVNDSKILRKKMGTKYNAYSKYFKNDLTALKCNEEAKTSHITILINQWMKKATPVFEQITNLRRKKKLSCPLDDLIGSLLHMHNNRMFRAYGRQHELLVHDLMRRLYLSSTQK